jgi:hypothetical protein
VSNQFDDISKGMATSRSRRGMFKMLGVGAAGALFAAFKSTKSADAAPTNCLYACRTLPQDQAADCILACNCTSIGWQVCGTGKSRVCCPPRTKCIVLNNTANVNVVSDYRYCQPIPMWSDPK